MAGFFVCPIHGMPSTTTRHTFPTPQLLMVVLLRGRGRLLVLPEIISIVVDSPDLCSPGGFLSPPTPTPYVGEFIGIVFC